jgi:hypothetical protein
VCSQRRTAETSIARQRLARHVSAATDRLIGTKFSPKLTDVSAAADGLKNSRGTTGNSELYSVLPGDMKGGHIIDSAVIE